MFRYLSLALGLVIAASAAPVHAGTSTSSVLAGHWSGSLTCKGFVDGVKVKEKSFPDLEVTHTIEDPLDLNIQSQTGRIYDGDVSFIVGKDDQVTVVLSSCEADPEGPAKGELGHGTIKFKKNGDLLLKAVSVLSVDGGAVTCKWKYELTDPTPPAPAVPSCSEAP